MTVVSDLDPRDPRAAVALRSYMTEVLKVCGMNGESLTHAVSDVGDYCPPDGAFLVVLQETEVVACAGLRRLHPEIGEIKRMWVSPAVRGRGIGAALLAALEQRARHLGFEEVRLDTNASLTAALALYTRHGYEPIADYNGNPDATHFFAKRLRTIQG